MAIKVSTTTVITNSLVLQNIANTDVTTRGSINYAVAIQDNVLRIYDSTGTEVRTLYAAAVT
jgi:hypothetical protein